MREPNALTFSGKRATAATAAQPMRNGTPIDHGRSGSIIWTTTPTMAAIPATTRLWRPIPKLLRFVVNIVSA